MRSAMMTILMVLLVAVCVGAQEQTTAVPLTVEAQVCAGIEDRMPAGATETFAVGVENVYVWCKVTGAADSTSIKVVWTYQGEDKAVVELPIKSPSWRTWSSKAMLPTWTGNWEVKILDTGDNVLKGLTFTITAEKTQPAEDTTSATE